MKKKNTASQQGKLAEDIAAKFITEHKLTILERNFHCRFGEIDLIALDDKQLVFIEVRYRRSQNMMNAIETIDQKKCHKIITTSEYYINQHRNYRTYQFRYDVIAITGQLEQAKIEWIKNAFQA